MNTRYNTLFATLSLELAHSLVLGGLILSFRGLVNAEGRGVKAKALSVVNELTGNKKLMPELLPGHLSCWQKASEASLCC